LLNLFLTVYNDENEVGCNYSNNYVRFLTRNKRWHILLNVISSRIGFYHFEFGIKIGICWIMFKIRTVFKIHVRVKLVFQKDGLQSYVIHKIVRFLSVLPVSFLSRKPIGTVIALACCCAVKNSTNETIQDFLIIIGIMSIWRQYQWS